MKIKHVMSDGTKRDSIREFMVPREHPVYGVLIGAYRRGGMILNETTKEADQSPKGRAQESGEGSDGLRMCI